MEWVFPPLTTIDPKQFQFQYIPDVSRVSGMKKGKADPAWTSLMHKCNKANLCSQVNFWGRISYLPSYMFMCNWASIWLKWVIIGGDMCSRNRLYVIIYQSKQKSSFTTPLRNQAPPFPNTMKWGTKQQLGPVHSFSHPWSAAICSVLSALPWSFVVNGASSRICILCKLLFQVLG